MTTKTCTNGHTMTGIGFDECPECEAPWMTTPTVEEIEKEFRAKFPSIRSYDEYCGALAWFRTTITTLCTIYWNR